jgi:acetyl-CoA C-acetyltransferase
MKVTDRATKESHTEQVTLTMTRPRPDTTLALAALKPVYLANNGGQRLAVIGRRPRRMMDADLAARRRLPILGLFRH